MTPTDRHLLVPALAAPGPREPDRRPPTSTTASRCARRVDVQLEVARRQASGVARVDALPVSETVALFGPGDIVGIDRRAIVRTEPRDWITNFEPNYLAGDRVLRRGLPVALHAGGAGRGRPAGCGRGSRSSCWPRTSSPTGRTSRIGRCRTSTSTTLDAVPAADELWAWAHVHVNRTLPATDAEFVSNDMGAVIPRLQAVLDENPDLALLAHRLPAQARGEHRATTRS